MNEFKFTDDVRKEICNKVGVDESLVDIIHKIYEDFSEKMKFQYLAHLIRTIEETLRDKPGFQKFMIRCMPYPYENDRIKRYSSAQYYPKQKYYCIYYSSKLKEKLIRVRIAHELGHLVLETFESDYIDTTRNTEKLSSVFGILAIMGKNDFYSSETDHFLHDDCQSIITDFCKMMKLL